MFKDALIRLRALGTRFAGDRRGNVAIMFGFMAIPTIALAGAAIDFSNGLRMKAKMQASIDAAALATARYASDGDRSESEISDYANKFFEANFNKTEFGTPPTLVAKVNKVDGELTISANATTKTYIIQLVGIPQMGVGVFSSVKFANRTVDVALVLDNSGSMGDENRLVDVKDAAKKFAKALFGDTTSSHPNLQIGIVPFNHTVNVGSGYATASWMDTGAVSPIHSEIFSTPANRFTLYNQMQITWPGCVEVRPQPYDVHDFNPSTSEMDSDEVAMGTPNSAHYFVPWFMPDEPDYKVKVSGSWKYILWNYNRPGSNYRDDGFSYSNSKDNNGTGSDRWFERQGNVAKYNSKETSDGPAEGCYVRPITDLTNSLAPLETEIDKMVAKGSTNIMQGFAWGWRLVSHGEPFTKGRDPLVDKENLKFVILLTDGVHYSVNNQSNPNGSDYGAFGYANTNRLKLTSSNTKSNREKQMNQRLAKACEHAKASGIQVFTITYGSDLDVPPSDTTSDEAQTKAIMKGCASKPSYYYHSPSNADAIFSAIADQINSLYLNK